IAKVMEDCTLDNFFPEVVNKLDTKQFALPKKSTTHALVYLLHSILVAFERGSCTARLFFADFKKGFDLVDHNVIIKELTLLGTHPSIIRWIKAFLCDREQCVRVGTSMSSWKKTNGGLPQALEIIPRFSSSLMPLVVNEISDYALERGMELNYKKCKQMLINFLKYKGSDDENSIYVAGKPVETVSSFKLLGVWISNDLSWNTHVDMVLKKANSRLYALRLLKKAGLQASHIVQIYISFIRSRIEYASPVWSSIPKSLSDILESVQKRALRIAYPDLLYDEALEISNLQYLSTRRDIPCKKFVESLRRDVSPYNPLTQIMEIRPGVKTHDYDLRNDRTAEQPLWSETTERLKNFAQIKARQKAYCRGDKPKYDQLCKKVSKLIRNAKQSFYHTEGRDLRQKDPAKWYKTVYTLLGAETNHNSLQTPSNEDLSKVAENLQTAFTNPWKDINVDLPDINEVNHLLKDTSPPLPSLGQVRSCLKHLNPKKATGIDKIPAWFLKHYCDDLTPVIHSIVIGSITQSKYPTAYKHAIVTPVPKIHQPKDINNDFRQISVLPHLAKMIEKIQLELNSHDLAIKDNQHAFVKNRSTVSALISMTQKWFDVTDNSNIGRKGVHTTFLDFKKAFDLVDHRILLIKLAEMNVSKAFWSWVKCFLTERTQHVNLHGVISSSAPCPAGVPQGSVISPTLFNIHINDLENTLTNNLTNTHKYADDCTLDEVVANGALSNMQESTNQVMNWANDNKMMVNPKKTKDQECRKSFLPPEIGLLTYTSKIRPILEYASPVWGGIPKYLEAEIERVQQRSLRILGLEKDTLPTLKERRDKATCNELKRIVEVPKNPCNRFLSGNKNHTYELRRTRDSTPRQLSKTHRHSTSFIPRACRLTNS
ncbi:RNA-directed DNA polymerase from mobile element jockey, partial [Paramuricea clavata]